MADLMCTALEPAAVAQAVLAEHHPQINRWLGATRLSNPNTGAC